VDDELACQAVEEIRLLVVADVVEADEPTNDVVLKAPLFVPATERADDLAGVLVRCWTKISFDTG